MCVLRLPACVQEKLHCVQLKGFFSLMRFCVSLEVSSCCALCRRIHTVNSWRAALLNGSACVTSGYRLVWRSSCTVCSWRASLQNGLACVSWGHQLLCRSCAVYLAVLGRTCCVTSTDKLSQLAGVAEKKTFFGRVFAHFASCSLLLHWVCVYEKDILKRKRA